MMDETTKMNIIKKAEEYYANGEMQQAHDLVSGSEFDENVSALWVRESTIKLLGDEKDRIKTLEKILELQQGDGTAHFVLGNCYYRQGDFERSVMHFEEALKTYPKHPTILSTLPLAKEKLEEIKKTQAGV